MTTFQRNLIIAVLLAVLLGVSGWFWYPREPVSGGLTLSEWVRLGVEGKVPESKVKLAVKDMGPDALPFLVQMLRAREADFSQVVARLLNQQNYVRFDYLFAPNQNLWAAKILQDFGGQAAPVFPKLVGTLQAEDVGHVLTTMAACGPSSLPYLYQVCTNDFAFFRDAAIYALIQGGFDDPETIKVLGERLNDESPVVRSRAVSALGKLTHKPNLIVPLLVTHLPKESVASVKATTILNLKYFGRSATIALPQIRAELESEHGYVREQVVGALVAINPDADTWIPVLIRLVEEDPDLQVRVNSLYALREFGTNAQSVVPAIQRQFQHPDPRLRLAIVEALDKITNDFDLVRPLLLELWDKHGLLPPTITNSAEVIKAHLLTNQSVAK